MEEPFTPLGLYINEVFNAIKNQSWIKRLKSIQYNPTLPEVEENYSYYNNKGHQTVHCISLQKHQKELICQDFLKEYVLTPEAASDAGQLSVLPPTQSQHMITQYKAIE